MKANRKFVENNDGGEIFTTNNYLNNYARKNYGI